MKVETAAKQLLFSTLRIQSGASVGTGAIVSHRWTGEKEGPFLVTNKHVIAGSKVATLTFIVGAGEGDDRTPVLGQKHSISLQAEGGRMWTGHPSDEVDIAVLPLGPVIRRIAEDGVTAFYRAIPTAMIPNDDEMKDVDAVEDVLFVGYPSGVYDTANNLPIARMGITATPPTVDYEGQPTFLIDASVFPGSSGSPVLLYKSGAWSTRDNQLRHGEHLRLLGILGSAYLREDEGTVRFEEIPAALRPIVKTRQMIDLGVVYKARCIVETIEVILRNAGEISSDTHNGARDSEAVSEIPA